MKAAAALASIAVGLLPATARAQAPAGGGRGVQVRSCSYWQERIQFAANCAAQNRRNAAKMSGGGNATVSGGGSGSMSGTYMDAARACDKAKLQYQAELNKCQAQQSQAGASAGAGTGGQGQPDPTQQLRQALQELARQGNAQAQDAIARLRDATKRLGQGYGGAGVDPRDIAGLPESAWTDDSLADLGDSWGELDGSYYDTSGVGPPRRGRVDRGNDPIDGSDLPDVIDFDEPTDLPPPDDGGVLDALDPGDPLELPPAGEEVPGVDEGGLPAPDYADTGLTSDADLGALPLEAMAEGDPVPEAIDGLPVAEAGPDAGYGDPGPDLGGVEPDIQEQFAGGMAGAGEEWSGGLLAGREETEAMAEDADQEEEAGIMYDVSDAAYGCVDPSVDCSRRMQDLTAEKLLRRIPATRRILEFRDDVEETISDVKETAQSYFDTVRTAYDQGRGLFRKHDDPADVVDAAVDDFGWDCPEQGGGSIRCVRR